MPGSTPVNVKNGQANEKWQTNDGYDPRKIASDAAQGGGGAGGGGGGGGEGAGGSTETRTRRSKARRGGLKRKGQANKF